MMGDVVTALGVPTTEEPTLSAGTIHVTLQADTTQFNAAIDRVQRHMDRIRWLRWHAVLLAGREDCDGRLAEASGTG